MSAGTRPRTGTPGIRRIVLVGFMASGKSTVGRLLADRLGWIHIDFDDEIEREHGATVAEIFARDGEAGFRAAETEITKRLIARDEAVLTPGGGWITNRDLQSLIPPGTLTVWLKASLEEVVRRVQADGTAASRPLLRDAPDEVSVRTLLADREPLYRRADLTIDTTGRTPQEVAAELVQFLSSND